MKWAQLLGLQGPWWRQVCRGTDCLHHRSYGPVRVFFKPLVAGDEKASLASFSPYLLPFRHLEGSLPWDPSVLFHVSGTQRAPPAGFCTSSLKGASCVGSCCVVVCQAFDWPGSLLFSC